MPHWDIKKDMPDCTGKVAIVTGGNTGIGLETCRYLALRNAKVYMASRTESRALAAIEKINTENPEIKSEGKPGIEWLPLDLVSIKSCQNAAKTFLEKEKRLDILINNAGIMAVPYELTAEGTEIQFQSNHFGHFAFTVPLLPTLIETSKEPNSSVRIVQLTSRGHQMAPSKISFKSLEDVNRDFGSTWTRYGQLANILFSKELSKRLENENIYCSAVHPGVVNTELVRGPMQTYPWAKPLAKLTSWFLITPYDGALTTLYTATSPDLKTNNWRGEYFVPYGKKDTPSAPAQDSQLAADLWALSEKFVEERSK
ncbi:NAD(P)-binding protein [Sistotremastrum niveocremeum HHB9708]|uniref:NAD(P)-binding protein n=1 Tax=Sistotremastrum niveocremeum HHB9708 TaxID=1314777 RepID=A0A164PKL6_9AGAM|nr:NAD(P)-binding protein [Sistotremastrum niveocremeum HHB9708]